MAAKYSAPMLTKAFSSPEYEQDHTVDPFLAYTNSEYSMIGMPTTESPHLGFDSLNLNNNIPDYSPMQHYAATVPNGHAPYGTRPYTPVDAAGISPQITNLSQANLSNSELSGNDSFNSTGRHSREASSGRETSPPGGSLVHRQPLRQNSSRSTGSSTRTRTRRARSDDIDSDDDALDNDYAPSSVPGDGVFDGLPRDSSVVKKRREEIRRQRIESEQRRRDELRDGYKKLKDVLPPSNQKASKVSLLDRATLHIRYLEMTQSQLQARLSAAENETQRLRLVNEKLSLSAAEHNQQAAAAAHAAVQAQQIGMPQNY